MADPTVRKRMDEHVVAVRKMERDLNVTAWFGVSGPMERPQNLETREGGEHFLRAMIYEGFCCTSVVQRSWLKAKIIHAVWDPIDGEPNLNGVPDGTQVWRGVLIRE